MSEFWNYYISDLKAQITHLGEHDNRVFGVSDELKRAKESLDYWSDYSRWYYSFVDDVIAHTRAGEPVRVLRIAPGSNEVIERLVPMEGPEQSLERWARAHQNNIPKRLECWVNELVERGQLDADFAATLDFSEPVNEAQVERNRKAAEDRQAWSAGLEEMKELVKVHSQSKGQDWGADWRDALAMLNRGNYGRDARGIGELGAAVAKAGLIPVGKGVKSGVKGMLAKIGV